MEEGQVFKDQVVFLAEVVHYPQTRIRNVTFHRCTIVGPSVLMFLSVTLGYCFVSAKNFEDCLWPIERGRRIIGAIMVEECTFEQCQFQNIGFAGTPEMLTDLRELFKPLNPTQN